jgi:hypothetical protein
MPLFEEETWGVAAQLVENVRRGEAVSHVGYLIVATKADGTETEIVDDHGIGAGQRDLAAARLFAASKDMFNASEILLPFLRGLSPQELDEEQRTAIALLEVAVRDVVADLPEYEAEGARP